MKLSSNAEPYCGAIEYLINLLNREDTPDQQFSTGLFCRGTPNVVMNTDSENKGMDESKSAENGQIME